MAQRLIAADPKAPILARLASDFDSVRLVRGIESCNGQGVGQVDWLIKWTPRTTDMAAFAARLDVDVTSRWEQPRAGKRAALWEQAASIEGIQRPVRRVDTRSAADRLILPGVTLEGWTTSLPVNFLQELIYRARRLIEHGPRGVRDTRCAQACERPIGVPMSTGTSLPKPRGATNLGMGTLTINLRQKSNGCADAHELRYCVVESIDKLRKVVSAWTGDTPKAQPFHWRKPK